MTNRKKELLRLFLSGRDCPVNVAIRSVRGTDLDYREVIPEIEQLVTEGFLAHYPNRLWKSKEVGLTIRGVSLFELELTPAPKKT